MSTPKFVTLTEITRHIIKTVAAKNDSQSDVQTVTPSQVQSVFKCVGLFVSSLFKKNAYD
jgi:hypothetical protein